jgi:hypothetical protein
MDDNELVPLLLERMRQAPRDQALMLCRRVLTLVLANGLSRYTWDVLAEIAEDDALWSDNELAAFLVRYDLPGDRETLREMSLVNAGTIPGLSVALV